MNATRRSFLVGAIGVVGGGAAITLFREGQRTGVMLSAFEDARGDQYVGGLSLADGRVFGVRTPLRAHGCAVDPRDADRVIFFARRPGAHAFELRRRSLALRTAFTTPAGRHLAGHGVFSREGDWLFTPEHDYEQPRGVVSVRDARTFDVVQELDTHGLDPHELAWTADHSGLLVANGGILTHPRSYRQKLNVDTMDPSLCVLDAKSGERLDQQRLPDHLLSIRHLAVCEDVALLGLQYEGAREQAPGVAAVYRRGAALRLLTTPARERARLNGYVASVAISESRDLLAAACPYGAGVACWSLRTERYLGVIEAREAYGLSRVADGSLLASQRDGTALALDENRLRSHFEKAAGFGPIRWDDHWVAV